MKKIVLLVFFMFIFCFDIFAVPPQKKIFDGLLVETGTSTEDIMPLLANIAGRQQVHFKRKGYFERIYGQYRGGYILVIINSKGKINNIEELAEIGGQISHNIITGYPSSEGRLEIYASSFEPWYSMTIKFKNGKTVSKEIVKAINENTPQMKDSVKFGLSKQQRERFCHEQDEILDKAITEAEKRYGTGLLSIEEADKFIAYKDRLYDKYEKELLEKYGLTEEQAREIYKECGFTIIPTAYK